jgi:hypothetical protein
MRRKPGHYSAADKGHSGTTYVAAARAEKRIARPLFGRIPKRFYLSQRNWSHVDLERCLLCNQKEILKSPEDFVHGRTPEAASKQLDGGTTQSRSGQRNYFARAVTNLHESYARQSFLQTFLRYCLEHSFRWRSPEGLVLNVLKWFAATVLPRL